MSFAPQDEGRSLTQGASNSTVSSTTNGHIQQAGLEPEDSEELQMLSPQDTPTSPMEQKTPAELKQAQQQMEEKVYQIWTVLSAFEESSAGCISDMLLHVSNGAYYDGVQMAGKFILHVDILFSAIDDLETQMREVGDQSGKC